MKKPPVKKGGRFFHNSLSIKWLRFTLLLGLDERASASAVYADGKRRVKVHEPEPGGLLFGLHGIKYAEVQGVSLPGVGVYVHITGVEGGEILEEVSALAWIYAEIGQGALHHAPPPSA